MARGLRLVEEGTAGSRPPPARAPRSSRWAFAVGALGLAAAAGATALLLARGPRAVEPLRFAVAAPAGVLLSRPTMGTPFAVSPDGRRIVFSGGVGGQSSLWLWSAEDGQSHRLEDTSGGISPFFSPDGREIAFFAGDDLRRVPVDGGPATTITAAPVASSGSWGSDGTILFTRSIGAAAGIYSVPARGGEPRPIALAPSPRERGGFARFLPDGRHYLFLKGFGLSVADRRLCVASVDGGEPDCFASCQSQAEYSGSGHVLCVRAGTLVALPFDARSRRPTGEAITVARDVRWFGPSGSASFAVSADGTTLVHEPRPAASRLAWLDRVGRQTAAVGEPGALGLLQLAPDGRRVAVDVMQPDGRGRDLWAFDTGSGVASRLTFQSIDASAATWSPDGQSLAYAKAEDGPPDVTVLHLDGTGREEVLLRAPGRPAPEALVSRRPLHRLRRLLAGPARPATALAAVSLDGKARRVTSTPSSSYHGRFSPDGRRLAYVSEESGGPEVYVAPLQGGVPRRVSRAGGLLPRWRGDGSELFFLQPDGLMMALPIADEDAVPKALFHLEGVVALDFDYDVARDGQRFLVRLTPEAEGAAGLRVALEWSRRLGQADDAER